MIFVGNCGVFEIGSRVYLVVVIDFKANSQYEVHFIDFLAYIRVVMADWLVIKIIIFESMYIIV